MAQDRWYNPFSAINSRYQDLQNKNLKMSRLVLQTATIESQAAPRSLSFVAINFCNITFVCVYHLHRHNHNPYKNAGFFKSVILSEHDKGNTFSASKNLWPSLTLEGWPSFLPTPCYYKLNLIVIIFPTASLAGEKHTMLYSWVSDTNQRSIKKNLIFPFSLKYLHNTDVQIFIHILCHIFTEIST